MIEPKVIYTLLPFDTLPIKLLHEKSKNNF
jgi:hypothetical protein